MSLNVAKMDSQGMGTRWATSSIIWRFIHYGDPFSNFVHKDPSPSCFVWAKLFNSIQWPFQEPKLEVSTI